MKTHFLIILMQVTSSRLSLGSSFGAFLLVGVSSTLVALQFAGISILGQVTPPPSRCEIALQAAGNPTMISCPVIVSDPTKIINVKAAPYNAKGDGLTDDSRAFYYAAAALQTGSSLYIPEGKYKIGNATMPRIYIRPYANITIYGDGAGKSILLPQYSSIQWKLDHPDSGASPAAIARGSSPIVFGENIQNVHLHDFAVRSQVPTTLFPESYSGIFSNIQFGKARNVLVERLQVDGGESGGIRFTTGAPTIPWTGAYNVVILDSLFQRNRVAGIFAGNVDGMLVYGNRLYWNGLPGDGGTGYGFAGSSSELPRNIYIVKNDASDNIRKGIDFHAGQQLTITDNTVARNGIYGIFVSGESAVGRAYIARNVISGMTRENRELSKKMVSFTGESQVVGIFAGLRDIRNNPRRLHSDTSAREFIIEENVITGMSKDPTPALGPNGQTLAGYPLLLSTDIASGSFIIRNNFIEGNGISNIIRGTGTVYGGAAVTQTLPGLLRFIIENNRFAIRNLANGLYPFQLANVKLAKFTNNTISITRNVDGVEMPFDTSFAAAGLTPRVQQVEPTPIWLIGIPKTETPGTIALSQNAINDVASITTKLWNANTPQVTEITGNIFPEDVSQISLTMKAPTTITRTQTATYVFTVKNNGPVAAEDVVLKDPLKGAFLFRSATGASCRHDGTGDRSRAWGNVICDPFTLAPGETRTITIIYDIPLLPPCVTKTVQHFGVVTTTSKDFIMEDNTTQEVKATVRCPQA